MKWGVRKSNYNGPSNRAIKRARRNEDRAQLSSYKQYTKMTDTEHKEYVNRIKNSEWGKNFIVRGAALKVKKDTEIGTLLGGVLGGVIANKVSSNMAKKKLSDVDPTSERFKRAQQLVKRNLDDNPLTIYELDTDTNQFKMYNYTHTLPR